MVLLQRINFRDADEWVGGKRAKMLPAISVECFDRFRLTSFFYSGPHLLALKLGKISNKSE
jgi:hypothetical protein